MGPAPDRTYARRGVIEKRQRAAAVQGAGARMAKLLDCGSPLPLWLLGLAGAAWIVMGSGCAGYKLGPTNGMAAGSKSVQVNPFINRVLEQPRLTEYVTSSLRKQLQQDGTFKLDTHKDGDVIVTGSIVDYERQHLSFQPRDILTPRDYRIFIVAEVDAQDRYSGKKLLARRVRGHTTVRVGSDLVSAERQAIPLAAEDLARNITALLVDGEW